MTETNRPAYLEQASHFLHNTKISDISAAALDRARWIFADCIPVIAAGMQVSEMRSLVNKHLARAAQGNSWVIGSRRRAAPLDAGLLNGTAGTWLELDEGNLFAMGHPGIQVVPAAVAVAQEIGASGADLLLAVTLGYEISARIARSATLRPCIHPHGTYGVIGAAVAVGLLKGLSQKQLYELLNISATMGMATSRNTLLEGATVRNIYTGHAAYMGQMAVQLVESGFTGEANGVGTVFGKVFSDTFDADRVVEDLGTHWLIAQNYFKLHCTGRYVHSAIDALEDALERTEAQNLNIESIDRIDIKAYKFAAMLSGKNITSSFGARFSIPFAIASILYHGKSGLESFDETAVANPAVQQLTQRVHIVEEPEYDKTYPQQQRCELKISLKNGTTITGRCEITKGESSKPHTPAELKEKFINLGSPVWGAEVTQTLFGQFMHLEAIPDFRKFAEKFSL